MNATFFMSHETIYSEVDFCHLNFLSSKYMFIVAHCIVRIIHLHLRSGHSNIITILLYTGQVAVPPVLWSCDKIMKCFVSKCVHRHLDDTFSDKAFCHMIIIQVALLLALCVYHEIYSHFFFGYSNLSEYVSIQEKAVQLKLSHIMTFLCMFGKDCPDNVDCS